jgi:RHH-type proline utilization regulon transcriptional repressor/proline dehydrogenase/delta 1-pyrroline-5-carboxylate dehydrogenase
MARRTASSRLDAQTLEQRTQAIGRKLFSAAKREHQRLSVLNRWTAQVMSWCLSDPAVKASVLRFIDVLPGLHSSREVARHIREYFTPKIRLPAALRLGAALAGPGLLTRGALAAVVRQLVEQVARQFIAEHHPEGVDRLLRALAERGMACSVDILGEQVLSEAEASRYAAQCAELLRHAVSSYAQLPEAARLKTCGPLINLSVKPSALTPRFDPISPAESVARASERLLPLLRAAAGANALINLDMEHYELRDLTLELAKHILKRPESAQGAGIGIVIQAYLQDAETVTEDLLQWVAAEERTLTVRLVKGAYWDSEIATARQRHWPVPVHELKGLTDLAFERLTLRLLQAHPAVTTAVASHNIRSIAHAVAAAEALGVPKQQLEFQFLYGMGEPIQAAVASLGYPVRIYTPIGELIPGMAYLVRRILENTANESFLRQDFFRERSSEELLRQPAHTGGVQVAPAEEDAERWPGEPPADFSQLSHREAMREALQTIKASLGRSYPLFLGGQAVETGQWQEVRNPAQPSQLIGRAAMAGAAEVDRAVQAAHGALAEWSLTPARERCAALRRAAGLMRDCREELAAWMVVEVGKTWREADADIVEAIEFLEYYSHAMLELGDGKPLLQAPGERNAYFYQPRGVAAVIAPWNFPSAILTGMAAAALAAGNAVILKPAEQSPVIAAQIAQLLRAAGIPPGAVQYLPGTGEAGAALVAHPGVHLIMFTGSKAVGLAILETCSKPPPGQRFVKHVVAEMGGKNAVIIDADADLDAAVAGTLRSAFFFGGQKCSAASRVIIHEAVYERFLERLSAAADRLVLGDPSDPATDIGPLIETEAQRRLHAAAERAATVGRVVYRYPAERVPHSGHFVGPVIVSDVPAADPLASEELFGPLLCAFRARSFEQALAMANDSAYALTGGVYSRSPRHLERAALAFEVGNLYLNRPITGARVGRQPFGGHKLSGLGTKAGGPDYLAQLMVPRVVCTDTTRYGIPME